MPAVKVRYDAYGHSQSNTNGAGANLTAGAVSTTVQGTIAGLPAAGAAPTVTFGTGQRATDMAGTFTLNPVTGGGAQAAGAVATVFFAQAFEVAPAAVNVDMCDNAAGASGVAIAASSDRDRRVVHDQRRSRADHRAQLHRPVQRRPVTAGRRRRHAVALRRRNRRQRRLPGHRRQPGQ